ncbi:MAG: hypothetical protein IIZ12_07400 [Eggerthellaceae bacterium]|nr:hypothetical protein [Eggerthellaceae bacterium]MBR2804010.1 hypothetical protein [Eggerthellaceae bacterium]
MTTKKISKKQRVALKEIDKITKERKRDLGIGIGAVALMAIFVILFNGLGYNMGFIDPNNVLLRGTMYVVAMVLAGVSGIFLMHASQKKNKIDGFRQQAGISREVLEAWQNGEYDEQ